MYTIKELAALYKVSHNTLTSHMKRCGVDLSTHQGKGNKPRLGYVDLLPFFRKYGDRTGMQKSYVAYATQQLYLFTK